MHADNWEAIGELFMKDEPHNPFTTVTKAIPCLIMGVSSCENPIYRVLLPNGYITHSRNVAIGNIDQRQPDVIFPTIFDFVQTKTHGDSGTVQLEEALRAFEDTVPTDD